MLLHNNWMLSSFGEQVNFTPCQSFVSCCTICIKLCISRLHASVNFHASTGSFQVKGPDIVCPGPCKSRLIVHYSNKFHFIIRRSLSVCESRHHAYICACIALRFHMQPHSDTKKVWACFLTHTSFPDQHSYPKGNSSDTSAFPVSTVSGVLLYHASISLKQHLVSITQWSASWAHMLQVEGSDLAARYLLLVIV